MKTAYFIGVKGVGMTSLACAMQDSGWQVTGSDIHDTFITDEILAARKIGVYPLNSPVPESTDLIVHSAAYEPPSTSIRTLSLASALAEFVQDRRVIAVAGVGGKTTTSAMLAALFHAAGRNVGYYIGTSTIAGLDAPGHAGADPYFVVEADEYAVSKQDSRAKFELMKPEVVITTNIVHDHPDIYPHEEATLAVFAKLIGLIKPGGYWICNKTDPLTSKLASQIHRDDITLIHYDKNHSLYQELELSVFGEQNRLDAVAAVLAAQTAGLTLEESKRAILAYRGAGRRQESHGEAGGRLLYDDYGHHPEEIAVTIKSFKSQFPGRRLLLVFESHTYTRTEALLPQFGAAIALADLPFLMPIFESAREKGQGHSVTPESFAAAVAEHNPLVRPLTWDNAAATLAETSSAGDIILTMGAGFVYKLHAQIKQLLQ